MSIISLSEHCFVEVFSLSENLIKKSKNDFNEMFSFCPENKHQVVHKDFQLEVKRYSKSYGQTPKIKNLEIGEKKYLTTYMFSGIDDSENNSELPEIFKPYLDFVNETFKNCIFNQITVNWYKNGEDYIAFHRDCEIGMTGNKKICIISFNENDNFRNLTFKYMQVEKHIPLTHGSIVMLNSDVQKNFKHGIRKSDFNSKRISLSFRQFESDKIQN